MTADHVISDEDHTVIAIAVQQHFLHADSMWTAAGSDDPGVRMLARSGLIFDIIECAIREIANASNTDQQIIGHPDFENHIIRMMRTNAPAFEEWARRQARINGRSNRAII